MRFGVFTLGDNNYGIRSNEQMLLEFYEQCLLADELGYHSAWIGEHHFSDILLCPSPEIFMAAVLARTKQIKIGSAIHVLPLNEPVRLAENYAMLDILGEGRTIFGAGKGFYAEEFEGFSVPLDEANDRFEEILEIIIKAWTEERLNHEGRFYGYHDLPVIPKPVQKPHPHVIAAVISPPSFDWCAEKGYSIMVAPFSLVLIGREEMKKRVDRFLSMAAENGHADLEVTSSWFIFCSEDEEELRVARECVERYLHAVAPALASDKGSRGPRYDKMREVLSNITYEQLAEVGAAFVGTPEECIERLKTFEYLGIKEVYCYMALGAMPHEMVKKSMRLFAERVMPQFSEKAASR